MVENFSAHEVEEAIRLRRELDARTDPSCKRPPAAAAPTQCEPNPLDVRPSLAADPEQHGAGLGCGRPPSAAAAASHLPPGDIRSFFCASDHQFSRHRRQRRRTRRCESDSPLVADATSTSPPARSSPQLLPPATSPSPLSTATTSLYDANAQIAPPSIREPSNGSDTHNSEHEGRGGPNPLTNQQREGRGRGAGLEREPG